MLLLLKFICFRLLSSDNEIKLNFDIRVCLVPSVSWISSPSHVALANSGKPSVYMVFSQILIRDLISPSHEKTQTAVSFRSVCNLAMSANPQPAHEHVQTGLIM